MLSTASSQEDRDRETETITETIVIITVVPEETMDSSVRNSIALSVHARLESVQCVQSASVQQIMWKILQRAVQLSRMQKSRITVRRTEIVRIVRTVPTEIVHRMEIVRIVKIVRIARTVPMETAHRMETVRTVHRTIVIMTEETITKDALIKKSIVLTKKQLQRLRKK